MLFAFILFDFLLFENNYCGFNNAPDAPNAVIPMNLLLFKISAFIIK